MGCTDSSVVAQNKPKPALVSIPEKGHNSTHLLLGEISQNKSQVYNLRLNKQSNQPLTISQRPIPKLHSPQHQQQKSLPFKLPNFAQLTQLPHYPSLHLLTGGISHKLDHISSSAYLLNSKSNTLHQLPSLRQARYTHSAVCVGTRVFVLGGRYFGEDQQAILNKCQVLDFGGGENKAGDEEAMEKWIVEGKYQWEYIASMNVKRCSQLSVVYNDRIYVLGGYTGQYQRSVLIEYYAYKKQNIWHPLSVSLPFGIESCLAVNYGTYNQFTIFGGNSNWGPIDSILTLNLLQGYESIVSEGKLKGKKTLHKGYYQHGDGVFVLGGSEGMDVQVWMGNGDRQDMKNQVRVYKKFLGNYFSSQEQFQSLTQSSSTIQVPYNPKPESSPYEKSQTDEIAFIFGTSSQPFILQLNISVPYAYRHPMPLTIKLHALQGIIHIPQLKQYLIFGGISDSQQQVNSDTFIYNPSGPGTKSGLVGKMRTPRYAFGYKRIGDFVYAVAGGSADEEGQLVILSKCERLDLRKLGKVGQNAVTQWAEIAELPFGVISPMTIDYKNNLYVFGGMKQNKQRNKAILKYSEKQNKWIQLKFTFSFGLQASSIYHKSQHEYLIFGGRVVNGDTNSIWALTFISGGQDCVFEERGKMKQAKCLHNVYKPKHQNFVVVLGGEKEVLSFYDCQSLKPIESDILTGMKRLFGDSLGALSDKSLKNYTMVIKE